MLWTLLALMAAAEPPAGPVALYDFRDTDSAVVRDRSGVGEPLDLHVADAGEVRRSRGSLEIVGDTIVRTRKPATRLLEAVRTSGAVTVEAWLTPAGNGLEGPARIVTLSRSVNERAFTLGQQADAYDVRLNTTRTDRNGNPSLASAAGQVRRARTHVVHTRERDGRTRLYLDGKQHQQKTVAGGLDRWTGDFTLALGNEIGGGRPWRGTYHLVAVYDRALAPAEVAERFADGPATSPEILARRRLEDRERFFVAEVAPVLAARCVECHDAATAEGGLDLSVRDKAFAGGDSGSAVVAGQSADSVLWQRVEDGSMPHEHAPLTADEKRVLKTWIDDGAAWAGGAIDPAVYDGRPIGGLWVQRLTVPEYVETVRATVGVDIAAEARELLPRDLRADGFRNTAYNLTVGMKHVENYAKLAETIVGRMDAGKFAGRFSRKRRLTDDDMGDVIGRMGKWVLRAPLTDAEVVSFRGVATAVAAAGGDFDEAVAYVLQAMLQSPRFIYRIERHRGDGRAVPVGDYELASRLSYVLWGAPPDEALMKAAENGRLNTRDHVAAQVRRMLEDPRAADRSMQFVGQWLNLDRLDNLRPDEHHFPDWNPILAEDMRAETLAFAREVLWEQQRPLADLFNAQVTFLTPRLAAHYGLKPIGDDPGQSLLPAGEGDRRPDEGSSEPSRREEPSPQPSPRGRGGSAAQPLVRRDLTGVPERGGLLTHGSVLTVGGDEASMVARGLFVLQGVLRGVVGDPPPCVDTTPVPTEPGLTQRSIATARVADVSCGGCHVRFEPLAYGLERFDGLGTFRTADRHGNALREDGAILFPGTAEPVAYDTSAELMDLLAGSDRVRRSLTWKVVQFALGRPLHALDAPHVMTIHEQAQTGGGTWPALMNAIATSDLVRKTRTEPVPEPTR